MAKMIEDSSFLQIGSEEGDDSLANVEIDDGGGAAE